MSKVLVSFLEFARKKIVLRGEIANIIHEAKFPNIKSWYEMRIYLLHYGATHETMVAGRAAWRVYVRHREAQKRDARVARRRRA